MSMAYKIKSFNAAILIAMLIMLNGCLVGPDFEQPVFDDLPEEYRFSDESDNQEVNLVWWELFHDPVLVSLVNTALEQNKDLLIAISRIEEARSFLVFTKADQYPRFDLQGGANRGNFNGGIISSDPDEPANTAFISPVVNWELDFWGKFRRASESSRAQLLASEYSKKSVQISLISEVVGAYFLLLDFKERLRVSEQTLESREESLKIIQKRFDKGVIPEIDLNQAQVQRDIAAAAVPASKRLIANTENAISILLGTFPQEIKTDLDLYQQTIPPNVPAGLPSSLLERRPDILEALYLIQAQNALIGVAVAERFPSISISGAAGAATNDAAQMTIDGFAWNIAAGLAGPIFNFGQDKARVEIEEARTEQALYSYQNVVLNAFREVSDALIDIQTYREQVGALKKQVKAAENANRLSKMRYDQGFSSYLEVLDSERAQFSAQLDLSQATQEYYNAYTRLYKALGGGWISPTDMEESDTVSYQDTHSPY